MSLAKGQWVNAVLVAVALLLARSRVGKILQFEDEADNGTDALDWYLDSVQERRAESAAELVKKHFLKGDWDKA